MSKSVMIFCPDCGNKLKENAFFCEECGYKIPNEIENEVKPIHEEHANSKIKGKKIHGSHVMQESECVINEEEKVEMTVNEIPKKETSVLKNENLKIHLEDKSVEKKDFSVLNSKTKNESTKTDSNSIMIPIIISIIGMLICMIFTVCYIDYKLDNIKIEKNDGDVVISTDKEGNKNVTITDTGLAEAVNKVYDSVVIVENYSGGKVKSTGTGFVYKVDNNFGYILSNHHVIEGATEVKVIFTNDKAITATVVGSDSYSDIALLKVNKSDVITIAELGDTSKMRVGDTTFAVGAPIDSSVYSWTVTRGILSGKDRLVETDGALVMKVLQTDTAINSGNSGGPLCNVNGEVIGITNMKIASSSVEGMGFAIPIEEALIYANKFLSGEKIVRPYLGVSMYDVSSSTFTSVDGIYIKEVEAGSPAAKAGLRSGDIITKIENIKVSTSAYLKYELYKHNVGEKVNFTYVRDNKEYTTIVILGSAK